jgi:hypothetical protein
MVYQACPESPQCGDPYRILWLDHHLLQMSPHVFRKPKCPKEKNFPDGDILTIISNVVRFWYIFCCAKADPG